MDTTEMAALLGRPLTPIETTNFEKYLKIANDNLETLLCTPVNEVSETRVFDTRDDFKTAFIDIFNEVTEVKLDGEVVEPEDYSVRQWDKRNGSWYNSLVFDCYLEGKELEVTADWGFNLEDSCLPSDLQNVLAGLFGLISKKNKFDGTISSKQVEDFRISFRTDSDLDQEFYSTYSSVIHKYSLCYVGNMRQGKLGNC